MVVDSVAAFAQRVVLLVVPVGASVASVVVIVLAQHAVVAPVRIFLGHSFLVEDVGVLQGLPSDRLQVVEVLDVLSLASDASEGSAECSLVRMALEDVRPSGHVLGGLVDLFRVLAVDVVYRVEGGIVLCLDVVEAIVDISDVRECNVVCCVVAVRDVGNCLDIDPSGNL